MTSTRAQLIDGGIVLSELYAEYLAGETFVSLGRRYGVSPSALCKLMRRYGGENGWWVSKAKQAREAAMQDKITRIIGIAARVFGLKPGAIWRGERLPRHVNARFAAWLVAIECGATAAAIARAFEYDHTTVIHGRDRARAMAATDEIFLARLNRIRREAAQ